MPQLSSQHTVNPLRLVKEARDLLLQAARTDGWLRRAEAIHRAEEKLAKAEGVLRRGT